MSTATATKAEQSYSFHDDLEWFKAHQEELVAKYNGKELVIHNQRVYGAYDTALDAMQEGLKQFAAGTFSIQECISGPEAYTVVLSRADFSGGQ